jgi:hypothetical protein
MSQFQGPEAPMNVGGDRWFSLAPGGPTAFTNGKQGATRRSDKESSNQGKCELSRHQIQVSLVVSFTYPLQVGS